LVDVDFRVDCCRACAGLEPVSPIPCPIAIECEADPPNRLRQIVEHESCRKTQHPVVVGAHHLVASIVLGATFTVFLPVDLDYKPTSSAVEVSPPAKNLPLPNKAESIDRSPSNLRPDTTFGIRGLTPTRVGRGVLLLRRQWRRTVLGTAREVCWGPLRVRQTDTSTIEFDRPAPSHLAFVFDGIHRQFDPVGYDEFLAGVRIYSEHEGQAARKSSLPLDVELMELAEVVGELG
jgi:hypothetical protein